MNAPPPLPSTVPPVNRAPFAGARPVLPASQPQYPAPAGAYPAVRPAPGAVPVYPAAGAPAKPAYPQTAASYPQSPGTKQPQKNAAAFGLPVITSKPKGSSSWHSGNCILM